MTPYNKNARYPHIKLIPFFVAFITSLLLINCSNDDSPTPTAKDRHLANSINYHQQGQYRAAILEARNSLSKTPSPNAAVHLAKLYLELGQPRSAISLLEKTEEKNNEALLTLAEAHIAAQKFSSAQAVLSEVSDNAKNTTDFLLLSASTLSGLGEKDQALQTFNKILASEAENEKALAGKLILALERGDNNSAQELRKVLKASHGDSPESLLLLSQIEYRRQNFNTAEDMLMTAIHNTRDTDVMLPVKTGVLSLLIETLTQQGRFADAVPFNKLLSEANPGWKESQEALQKIVQQIQLGNWNQAEQLLNEFKTEYPGISSADSLLGLVKLQKGEFEDADIILENTVDPETASPTMVGASVMSKLKNNEKLEAFTILKEALATKPDNPGLLSMYGTLALELDGHEKESEQALQKVLELNPNYVKAYGVLAAYYFAQPNGKEKARDTLLKAYEFNPQVPDLQAAILTAFSKAGMMDEAQSFAATLTKDSPNSASTWMANAVIALDKNDPATAKKHLLKSIQIDEKLYPARALLAATLLKLNDKDGALKAMQEALKIFPDSRNLLLQSAQLYLDLEDYASTEKQASELERIGEMTSATFIRADILYKKGETQQAYKLLTTEWDQRPNHRIAIAIARYAAQINEQPSDRFLDEWLAVAPNNPQAHLAVANIKLTQGDKKSALTGFEKVLSLDEDNVIALNNAAWFHQENGNNIRAIELANKVLALAPENAAILDTVGWVKLQNNDRSSLEILKKAANLAPNSKEIQEHYAEAKSRF